MAMAGDWQTLSERVIYDDVKQEADSKEFKSNGPNMGVRKRKFEGQEEDEEAEQRVARKAWGSTTRTYPSLSGEERDDLDSLLKSTKVMNREEGAPNEDSRSGKGSATQKPAGDESRGTDDTPHPEVPSIKKENSDTDGILSATSPNLDNLEGTSIKTEDQPMDTGVVFKKRKAKQIRQR